MADLIDVADRLEDGVLAADDRETVHLTVCATCAETRFSGEEGLGGGAKLLAAAKAQIADHPYAAVIALKPQRCLMACTEGCVASVASTGKMQYLLGRLPATEDIAAQLLDFAALYAEAPTGVTPNHLWPGVLGMHFLGRVPPPDPVEGDWTEDGCNL